MPSKAMTQSSDSQNPAASPTPLFFVHDTLSNTWYELDAEAWDDLVLQAPDPHDEFAYACPGCLRPLPYCSCPMEER